MYKTTGGKSIADLGKELTRMRGVIIERGLKPPELTPDQRDEVNETISLLTDSGVAIGSFTEKELTEINRFAINTYNEFQSRAWHDKDKGGHGPNYKEWPNVSKAYMDLRKKVDDRKLKLRDERKAKEEKLKKEKTTRTTQIEETKKVDESETERVKLRNTTHKTISDHLKKKEYSKIKTLIYNTKHNAYKSYNKDGKFGGREEGDKPIFTNA